MSYILSGMIADFFSWWYGFGWRQAMRGVNGRTQGVLSSFSIGLLARTLFAPFRQIDAGGVRGPIGTQFQAWAGRTFSRAFGAVLRLVTILAGLGGAMVTWLFGLVWLLLWPLLPILPLIGAAVWLSGAQL